MEQIKKAGKARKATVRAKKQKVVEAPIVPVQESNGEHDLLRHLVQDLVDSENERTYETQIGTTLHAFEDKPLIHKNFEFIRAVLPFSDKLVLQKYLASPSSTIVKTLISLSSDPEFKARVRPQYDAYLEYQKRHEQDVKFIAYRQVQMIGLEGEAVPILRPIRRGMGYKPLTGRYQPTEFDFERELNILRSKPVETYKQNIVQTSQVMLSNAFYGPEEAHTNSRINEVITKLIGTLLTKSKTVDAYATNWSRVYPFANSNVFGKDATLFRSRLIKGFVSPFRVLDLSIFDKIQLQPEDTVESSQEPTMHNVSTGKRMLYKRLEEYNTLLVAEKEQFIQSLFKSIHPDKKIPTILEARIPGQIESGRACSDDSIDPANIIYYYDEEDNTVYCFDIIELAIGIADDGEELKNKYTGRPFSRSFVTSILKTVDISEILDEFMEKNQPSVSAEGGEAPRDDVRVPETDVELIRSSPFLQMLVAEIFDDYDELYSVNHSCEFCRKVIRGEPLVTYAMENGVFVMKRFCDSKCLGSENDLFGEESSAAAAVEETESEPIPEERVEVVSERVEVEPLSFIEEMDLDSEKKSRRKNEMLSNL
jgi:hypothetical protein